MVLQEDVSDLSYIENNFNERDARIEAGDMIDQDKDSQDSDQLSSFDSQASRVNFWKDINTKDDEYRGAIFLHADNNQVEGKAGITAKR